MMKNVIFKENKVIQLFKYLIVILNQFQMRNLLYYF